MDRDPETPIENQRFTDADRETIRDTFRKAIRANLEMRELDLKMGKI